MAENWRLLYGVYSLHDNIAIWHEAEARERAEEVGKIRLCRTVGALRALAATLRWEDIDEWLEDLEDEPDTAPWDPATAPGVEDGDWPGLPTQHVLGAFGDGLLDAVCEATGAAVVETAFNGPYLDIPSTSERKLVASLQRLGYTVVRDDAVINDLGMQ